MAKLNSVWILVSLAAIQNWEILQYDVNNAYLRGELNEEVYMPTPQGYKLSKDTKIVCRLKKALYGLKQSPRAWFGHFTRAMKQLEYCQSNRDHTMFFKHCPGGQETILLVYVNGNDCKKIINLENFLA